MNALIAIDSFKGSLSSMKAGNAVAEGIKRVYKNANIKVCPIADGGEGTVEALVDGMNGKMQKIEVTGPLGKKIKSEYGIIEESKTAVIEMAAAAGITLISDSERNPMNTTTYGVGEIIKDAVFKGCRNFIIGIGGSATNDGGIGMLQALGFYILDEKQKQVSYGAKGLSEIHEITVDNIIPGLSECKFYIACDVTNPLCGENGCSRVFGPQKGADEKMIREMDSWLLNYAKIAKTVNDATDENYPGVGAAGGLGFAFLTFLNSELKKGIDLILKETSVEEYIKDADIVITGEGRLDFQSVMGKAPVGVASISKKYAKPVIAFSGAVTKEAKVCNEHGIDAYFPIVRGVCTLEEAMNAENAYNNLADTAEQVFRGISINL